MANKPALGIEQDKERPHVIVFSAKFPGYWGRGASIEEAIKNAQWLASGDKVFACACDDGARLDNIDGSLFYDKRGPVYFGTVKSRKTIKLERIERE